jgi:hypothetical protein
MGELEIALIGFDRGDFNCPHDGLLDEQIPVWICMTFRIWICI